MSEESLDEIPPYTNLISELADRIIEDADYDHDEALNMVFNLEEYIQQESGGFLDEFNRLLVFEAWTNLEKGLNMDMSLLKAGDIFIAIDYKEALSKIREDVFEEVESADWDEE